MDKLHFNSATFFLLAAVGVLPAACSSSDGRSLVLLDLELDTGVDVPASVHLRALQGTSEVKAGNADWDKPADRTMQIGLFIPSGVTGQVTIEGEVRTGDQLVAAGKVPDLVQLKVGGTVGPFRLVLHSAVTPPLNDGGVDVGATDAGVPGAEVNDSRPPELAPDGARLDDTGAEAQAPDVTKGDGPSQQPDVTFPGDDAKDVTSLPEVADTVTSLPEVADTVLAPRDGAEAPVDVITPSEVGHTPTWEPAQNVENDGINPSYQPVIAVDPVNEHVYVAWDEATAVKVKRWNRLSGAWEKTVAVENRGNPVSPAIGVDTKGNVLLLWGQNTGNASVDGVWVSRTTDGLTWSPATRITADPSFDVRLAVARNGTAHAAYNKQPGHGWPLFTAYYDGTGWTENPTTLDSNDNFWESDARIVVSGTGDGLLLFNKSWGVAGSALTGQSFTTPIMLDPNYETISAYDPSIAVNRKGEGIVLWTEATSSNTVLLGRTYNPSVGWSSVLPPIVTAETVAATAVALDEQDNATMVWQQNLAIGANLMGMHGSPTGSWGDAATLETDNVAGFLGLSTEYAEPNVAIDGSGNVLAVWRKDRSTTTTTTYGAFGTRFAAGSWLPQVQLGMKTGLDITGLNVSVADSGFGAATFIYWSDNATSDPDAYNVQVAFFRQDRRADESHGREASAARPLASRGH